MATGKNLPVYGIEGKLKEFAATKGDVKNKVNRIPGNQFRLADEDLYQEHDMKVSANIAKPRLEQNDNQVLNEAA